MGLVEGVSLSIFLAWFLSSAFDNAGVVVGGTAGVDRKTYIVHMDKTLMPQDFADHQQWYSSIVDSLSSAMKMKEQGPSLLYTYGDALHGFSAVLSPDELEALGKSLGFVSAYADKKLELDTTRTPEFLSLNAANGLWPASDLGKDVIVGVIDTGVWPESKSFSDHGMTGPIPARWKGACEEGEMFPSSACNSKLIGARYFSKGLRAANPRIGVQMNSARDGNGHGTHTAATAVGNFDTDASYFGYANGTASGIAPRARLAVYKVLGDEGSSESDIVAGIDQAVADGVDILSMSLGSRFHTRLYEDAVAIAAFGAMEKGVLVSTSAGNRGPDLGTTTKGVPWALVVAAGTVDRTFAGTLSLGNGVSVVGWTLFPAITSVQFEPLVYNRTLSACNSSVLLAEVPNNAVVICDYIPGSVGEQLNHVAASPARAGVFVADALEISRLGSFPCAGVVVTPRDAANVVEYAKNASKEATASIEFHQTIVGTKPAPVAAVYSSRGPAPALPGVLKPDLMAPGSRILAAWIPGRPTARIGRNWFLPTDYEIISGTSMACPHASGAAALLKGAHRDWSPAAIRSALMTTANPLDNTLGPIRDEGQGFSVASPLVIGAGQMDPNRALDPGLIYDATPQDYVNLLCASNFTKDQISTITKSSGHNCSNPSSDLNYPSFIALYDRESDTKELAGKYHRTVTNVGGGRATYKVKVVPPRNSRVTVSPETLEFGSQSERRSYAVSISYKSSKKGRVSFGSITWIEAGGSKRTVRSPVVVSPTVGAEFL